MAAETAKKRIEFDEDTKLSLARPGFRFLGGRCWVLVSEEGCAENSPMSIIF